MCSSPQDCNCIKSGAQVHCTALCVPQSRLSNMARAILTQRDASSWFYLPGTMPVTHAREGLSWERYVDASLWLEDCHALFNNSTAEWATLGMVTLHPTIGANHVPTRNKNIHWLRVLANTTRLNAIAEPATLG